MVSQQKGGELFLEKVFDWSFLLIRKKTIIENIICNFFLVINRILIYYGFTASNSYMFVKYDSTGFAFNQRSTNIKLINIFNCPFLRATCTTHFTWTPQIHIHTHFLKSHLHPLPPYPQIFIENISVLKLYVVNLEISGAQPYTFHYYAML